MIRPLPWLNECTASAGLVQFGREMKQLDDTRDDRHLTSLRCGFDQESTRLNHDFRPWHKLERELEAERER